MADYEEVSKYSDNGGRVLRAHHKVIERVPWQSSLSNHSGCYGWAQGGAKRVERLQKALDPIGVDHIPSPSTPGTILETIAKTGKKVPESSLVRHNGTYTLEG